MPVSGKLTKSTFPPAARTDVAPIGFSAAARSGLNHCLRLIFKRGAADAGGQVQSGLAFDAERLQRDGKTQSNA